MECGLVSTDALLGRDRAAARLPRTWDLRRHVPLARLLRDQGKRAEASDRLARIYAWFTEGFDTRDLIDAKSMLDELR